MNQLKKEANIPRGPKRKRSPENKIDGFQKFFCGMVLPTYLLKPTTNLNVSYFHVQLAANMNVTVKMSWKSMYDQIKTLLSYIMEQNMLKLCYLPLTHGKTSSQ